MRQVRLGEAPPPDWREPAVTIGNFDGVHRGHQALVRSVVDWARARSGASLVLTFDPHPARVLAPARAPANLTTTAQKAELLAGLGVDAMVVLPFDAGVAALAPEEFVARVLRGALGVRHVVVGEGFRFGRGQSGDVATLRRLGPGQGFTVEAIPPVLQGGEPVSSSRVREALSAGDVSEGRALLGRDYFVDATVVAGDGRGRSIGVPTANLDCDNEIVPARGVYAGRLRAPDGTWRAAVVNRGRRPTFGGESETVEAHVLGFSGDLYGSQVRLAFVERLREERRFAGAEALVAQIRRDVEQARSLLSTPGDDGV